MAIVAVGLRPCSGAILVLVFALAQGIFWAGIAATFVMGLGTAITVAAIATLTVTATGLAARLAATRTGYGALALRGIEVAASVVLLLRGRAARRLHGERAAHRLLSVSGDQATNPLTSGGANTGGASAAGASNGAANTATAPPRCRRAYAHPAPGPASAPGAGHSAAWRVELGQLAGA